jgi:hypothetical protein
MTRSRYFTEEGGKVNSLLNRAPPASVGYGQRREGSELRSTYGGGTGGGTGQKAGAKI